MYKATLFVLDKEYPLLALNCNFNQKADQTGRPIGRTFGGKLFVKFASTRDDAYYKRLTWGDLKNLVVTYV